MGGRLIVIWCILSALLLSQGYSHLDIQDEELINALREIVREEERISKAEVKAETEAKDWLKVFNEELRAANHRVALAEFEYNVDLTKEKGDKFTQVSVDTQQWMNEQTKKARQFLGGKEKEHFEDESVYRMLKLLTCSSSASDDVEVNRKVSELINKLSQIYGTTKIEGHTLDELEVLIGNGTGEERLRYWREWRDAVGPKMKPLYTELIENLNQGARDNGFSDIGEPWRAGDFGYETEDLEQMAADLFEEIRPLYLQLHAFVRRILHQRFPEAGIDLKGPIPAHLLGNMWAQQWSIDGYNPYPDEPEIDITPNLKDFTVREMFEMAEEFFMSIGLEPMTQTFWDKSMLSRPKGREVQCHGSASDLFKKGDFRIKMCTKKNQEDFTVIHHEMGHIEYFMEYSPQPAIFRGGANAAFHEAIGDTIALSVNTATHFKAINLLDSFQQNDRSDINLLFQMALQKVAFLPFGYLIDRYRWEVFRGNIDETNYNSKWWELRRDLQGVAPPVARTEAQFDPGAKYHIAANVPYIRYFFSFIAQFQFYEAMCEKSGHTGPIHRCDFYNSKEAGNLLAPMLKLGCSKEWPEAMEKMTGQKQFSAKAILNYFEPLHQWLIKENENHNQYIGWI